MNHTIFFAAAISLGISLGANAGTLNNGNWSPSGCGTRPEAPVIDIESADVETFNRSVKLINAWQKQIQAYHDCVVREANADASAINQAAAGEQAKINAASEKLNTDANLARNKLESSPVRGPASAPLTGSGMGQQGY